MHNRTHRWPAWKHAALRPHYRTLHYINASVRATPLRPLCTQDFIRLLTKTDEGKKMADCKRSKVMLELDTGDGMTRRTVVCTLEHPVDTRLVGGEGKALKLESVLGPWFTPAGVDVLCRRAKEQDEQARKQAKQQAAEFDRSKLHAQHLADDAPPTEIERKWLAAGYQVARVKLPGVLGTVSVAHDGEAVAHSADYKPADELGYPTASEAAAREQADFAARVADADRKVDRAPDADPNTTVTFHAPKGFALQSFTLTNGQFLTVTLRKE